MAHVHFVYFDVASGTPVNFQQGVASLTGTLREADHTVSLSHVTEHEHLDATRARVGELRPDVVALSFTTNQQRHVKTLLGAGPFEQSTVVGGGVHTTMVKEQALEEFPGLDGVCVGEGEQALSELCDRVDRRDDITTTPSFCFRDGDRIVQNPVMPIPDLEALALPDYSVFDYQRIIPQLGDAFPVLLARGCPYICTYCANHAIRDVYPNRGAYTRLPSAERSIRLLKKSLELYPQAKRIRFYDETFTLQKPWMLAFLEAYRTEIGLPFVCDTRFERVDDETAAALSRAGCETIHFGLESGNDWMRRKVLHRRHSNDTIRQSLETTSRHGIKTFTFIMVGMPYESGRLMRESLDFVMQLRPDFGIGSYFFPYPGTRIHGVCEEKGLIDDGIDLLSGVFERPALKEIFASHREVRYYRDCINTYFMVRLVTRQLPVPAAAERALMRVLFLFPFLPKLMMDPQVRFGPALKIRELARKLALRYLR